MKNWTSVLPKSMLAVSLLAGGLVAAQTPGAILPTTEVTAGAPSGKQSLTVPVDRPVPDHIIYHFFFIHVVNLDQAADKMEAEPKNSDYLRTAAYYRALDEKAAGLTDEEGAMVKKIAHDCIQTLNDQNAKTKAVIDARRAESPAPHNALTKSEMANSIAARNTTLTGALDQLKAELGDTSFAKLDTYVKSVIHPKEATMGARRPSAEPNLDRALPLQLQGDGGAK